MTESAGSNIKKLEKFFLLIRKAGAADEEMHAIQNQIIVATI